MPLYEYQCQDCGFRSEELQKLADPPLTVCPKCGGAFKRLISAPAFQFKGSGWYVTDYARQGSAAGGGKSGAASSEASSEAGSGSAATAESKAESGSTSSASETKPASPGSATP
jgi:putative FmdB family regulatory protein